MTKRTVCIPYDLDFTHRHLPEVVERQRSIPWCKTHGSRERRQTSGYCEGSDIWTNNPSCEIVEGVVWETVKEATT